MKKIIFSFAFLALALSSCKNDSADEIVAPVVLDAATQNTYDDQAIVTFLDEHYLDDRGNIKTFTTTDVPSATKIKLSALNPVTLPSGVVYIMRAGAQPVDGKTIGETDIISLMSATFTYSARKVDDKVLFTSPVVLRNTIASTGSPELDPPYYYANKKLLATNATVGRSFYEIEGFGEALRKFKAFDQADSANYNLQGVILVPSRAAFGKDASANYIQSISLMDRSFVFNFQVYKTQTRPTE